MSVFRTESKESLQQGDEPNAPAARNAMLERKRRGRQSSTVIPADLPAACCRGRHSALEEPSAEEERRKMEARKRGAWKKAPPRRDRARGHDAEKER